MVKKLTHLDAQGPSQTRALQEGRISDDGVKAAAVHDYVGCLEDPVQGLPTVVIGRHSRNQALGDYRFGETRLKSKSRLGRLSRLFTKSDCWLKIVVANPINV